jgi:RNA polymerase sigma factor (sigma-70 family)
MNSETLAKYHQDQASLSETDESKAFKAIHSDSSQDDWATFYTDCRPLMVKYAVRAGVKGSVLDDIVANVMMKLFVMVSVKGIDTGATSKGYLAVMVRHEACDYYRATKDFYGNESGMLCCSAKEELQFDSVQYDDDGEVYDLAVRQKLEDLTRAMGIVKKKVAASSWQMFCDVTIEGLSAQEVAEDMGVKTQTVYQRNFQIKRMIRSEAGFEQ